MLFLFSSASFVCVFFNVLNMREYEKFESLCATLSAINTGNCVSFSAMCSKAGADEIRMNNMFYENFGMSGEDVFYKLLGDTIVIAV